MAVRVDIYFSRFRKLSNSNWSSQSSGEIYVQSIELMSLLFTNYHITTQHEIGKKLECHIRVCFGNPRVLWSQFSLLFGHPTIFGVPVPHFGLSFGTLLIRALQYENCNQG